MNKFNVDDILNKADLYDLVRKAGGDLDKNGRCACPLHGGKNENGFHVYQKDGRDLFKCFTHDCGGGDAITFVMKWQALDFKGACSFLGGDIVSDPAAIEASAKIRFERSKAEHEEARLKMEARRHELQLAQMHKHYHETMKEWGRIAWYERGIDESYQGLWMLGSCDDKCINYKGEFYHTPSLTIPLVNKDYELQHIMHRLVNPPNPKDRYRGEKEGLGGFPEFFAYPDMQYNADLIWIIEGAIKTMVTATISPDAGWQFIGVTNQHGFDRLQVDLFKNKKVIVVPDPGTELPAYQFAKKTGARFLMTPDKIDDIINANNYRSDWLAAMSRQARKV